MHTSSLFFIFQSGIMALVEIGKQTKPSREQSPEGFSYRAKEMARVPRRPNTPCKYPGCARLVPYGRKYCDEHRDIERNERPNAETRGYGREWQKARQNFLKRHLWCVRCKEKGKFVLATVVDHIKPHRGDERLFWDEENWQPLCKSCHDHKTMTEDRNVEYKY